MASGLHLIKFTSDDEKLHPFTVFASNNCFTVISTSQKSIPSRMTSFTNLQKVSE